AHLFTDRPILSIVLSIFIVLVGGISYFSLPVSHYPNIVPPTIEVDASLPGASAKTVTKVVATPLEHAINGVENMIYMQTQSTDDGHLKLRITFKVGTDIDEAQTLVQNRVSQALPSLPEETQRVGVTTQKKSSNFT